ncbi:MAG: hypothetical protein H8E62_03665 [Planctomycetes bacterium]|nr:hypothetical protein [Planctomycetota bacterium]
MITRVGLYQRIGTVSQAVTGNVDTQVRLRQGYGVTAFAIRAAYREGWSQ